MLLRTRFGDRRIVLRVVYEDDFRFTCNCARQRIEKLPNVAGLVAYGNDDAKQARFTQPVRLLAPRTQPSFFMMIRNCFPKKRHTNGISR